MIEIDDFDSVLIIGAGTMGHSIAQVYAQAGFEVDLVDTDKKKLNHALKLIKSNPQRYGNADPRTLIIFDDCLHDNSWQKSKAVKNIF